HRASRAKLIESQAAVPPSPESLGPTRYDRQDVDYPFYVPGSGSVGVTDEAICFSNRRKRRKSSSHWTSGIIERAKSSKVACLNLAAAKAASVGHNTNARLPRSL